MNKSIEVNAQHISSVVYTDAIRVLSPEAASAFEKQSPAAIRASDARTRPVQGIQLASEELPGIPQYLFGVNYSGGMFRDPNKFDVPSIESLTTWQRRASSSYVCPSVGNGLQPKLMGELNEAVLTNIKQTIKLMSDRGMKVMLDMHNFARYRGKLIGSEEAAPGRLHRCVEAIGE